jgi:hypothetical protein
MWHDGEILKLDARTAVAAVLVLFTIMAVGIEESSHVGLCAGNGRSDKGYFNRNPNEPSRDSTGSSSVVRTAETAYSDFLKTQQAYFNASYTICTLCSSGHK